MRTRQPQTSDIHNTECSWSIPPTPLSSTRILAPRIYSSGDKTAMPCRTYTISPPPIPHRHSTSPITRSSTPTPSAHYTHPTLRSRYKPTPSTTKTLPTTYSVWPHCSTKVASPHSPVNPALSRGPAMKATNSSFTGRSPPTLTHGNSAYPDHAVTPPKPSYAMRPTPKLPCTPPLSLATPPSKRWQPPYESNGSPTTQI